MGGASKNRKIRDRVDSEGKYGRWKLQIIGSCYKSSRPRVGSPTNHFVYRFVSFKSLLAYRLVRLQVISSTSHTSSLIRVGSPKSQLSFTSVSPTSRFTYGSISPLVLPPPPPVSSPTAHLIYWSVSPTSHLAGGLVRPQVIPLTGQFRLQIIFPTGQLEQKSICLQCQFRYKPYRLRVAFSLIFGAYTERLLRERELSTKIYLGTEVKFCRVCNKH